MMKILTLTLLLMASTAHADERKDIAKRQVTAGLAAQAAGKYDEAIELYNKAYDAVPHPEILFDLGQAYRLKGDAVSAVDYYERYLTVEPRGRVASDATHWIAELRPQAAAQTEQKRLDAEVARRVEEAREADAARRASEARTHDDDSTSKTPPTSPITPIAPIARTPSSGDVASSNRRTYGVVAFSVAGASLVSGVVLGQLARSKLDDATRLCPSSACASDADTARANALAEALRTRGNLSTGLVAGGLLVGAIGGYLWWTGGSSDSSTAKITLAPVVTTSQLGVSLGGAF